MFKSPLCSHSSHSHTSPGLTTRKHLEWGGVVLSLSSSETGWLLRPKSQTTRFAQTPSPLFAHWKKTQPPFAIWPVSVTWSNPRSYFQLNGNSIAPLTHLWLHSPTTSLSCEQVFSFSSKFCKELHRNALFKPFSSTVPNILCWYPNCPQTHLCWSQLQVTCCSVRDLGASPASEKLWGERNNRYVFRGICFGVRLNHSI